MASKSWQLCSHLLGQNGARGQRSWQSLPRPQRSRALSHRSRRSLPPPLPRFPCPWHSPPGTNTPQAQPLGFGDPVPSLGQHREAQGPFLGVTSPQRDPGSAGLGETATEGASQGKTDLLPSDLSLLACGGALRQHPDTLCSLCSYSKV